MPMVISGVIVTLHNDLLLVMYIELCRTQTSEHTIKSGTIQKHAYGPMNSPLQHFLPLCG